MKECLKIINPETAEELADILADRIQERLLEHGWTMKMLSEASGIPYETMKKILGRKIRNPSLKSVYLIAKALGCSIDDLLRQPHPNSL